MPTTRVSGKVRLRICISVNADSPSSWLVASSMEQDCGLVQQRAGEAEAFAVRRRRVYRAIRMVRRNYLSGGLVDLFQGRP